MKRAVGLAAALLLLPLGAEELPYTPTDAYTTNLVRGFTVLVNPEVYKHGTVTNALFAELDKQFADICRVLPEDKRDALLPVITWVEWEKKPHGAAEYHPSAGWLRDNGYNPEKAGGVEINNARNFISWSRSSQPAMILHEMAHAYMFRFVQPGNPNYDTLKKAFDNAIATGIYDEVAFIGGGQKKAYALTDINEYFAELTESYFLKNDFYPFVREELKTHDPDGYAILEKIWGK
ncbi:MAG: hypothetical protein FWH21_07715 [Kiritimatiellaeota bacterium]|nr:hypothetical protein [Kiritimatiellota bacterium]